MNTLSKTPPSCWRHVWRGCGYLPICGNHPGTHVLMLMIFAGGAAGGWHGGIIMALLFGPIYLIGAHGRSVYDWQHSENVERLALATASTRLYETQKPTFEPLPAASCSPSPSHGGNWIHYRIYTLVL